MISVDFLVVGGGVVGLSAAVAMCQRGFSVAIVDKAPLETYSKQRVYAINAASKHLLSSLNAWPQIPREKLSPYEKMYVWEQKNHVKITFDCRDIGQSELGFIIEEHLLKQALYEQCTLTHLPPLEATTLIEHENHVILKARDAQRSEHHLQASFVFITDGAKSTLRQKLNIPLTQWPYHHHAIVATVHTEKSHRNTAYQIFTPEGPLAFLPLSDKHHCSIVWSVTHQHAESLQTLPDEMFNETLATTFEQKLGSCQLVSHRQQFELHMRHAEQYHGKRWILMGDAAHTIHPLAGLGLNLGLADLSTWLHLTAATTHTHYNTALLGAYQRQRKSATWAVIGLMELIKTTFSQSSSPIQWLRGFGMEMLNSITPLKRMMIHYASGAMPQTKSGTTPP